MSVEIVAALQDLIVEIRANGCDAAELAGCQQISNVADQLVREAALMAKRSERWAVEGFVSAGVWVASHTALPVARAKTVLREAESLEVMAHSRAAARNGLLDEARVQLLTGCQRTDPARYVHRHHWTVKLDEHQKPIFHKPDGTIHQHHPEGPQARPRPSGQSDP